MGANSELYLSEAPENFAGNSKKLTPRNDTDFYGGKFNERVGTARI